MVCCSLGDDSDLEVGVEDESTASYSYLSVMDNSHPFPEGVSGDISPLSSPEKDTSGEQICVLSRRQSLSSDVVSEVLTLTRRLARVKMFLLVIFYRRTVPFFPRV